MTPAQAFKTGFLLRCADEGLPWAETEARVKAAAVFCKQADGPLSSLASAAPKLIAAAVLMAATTGGVAGYGLRTVTDRPTTARDLQRQDLMAAYRLQTDRIRRAEKLRKYRQPTIRTPKLQVL
jgi:hypothetical protein